MLVTDDGACAGAQCAPDDGALLRGGGFTARGQGDNARSQHKGNCIVFHEDLPPEFQQRPLSLILSQRV
jgi:hypothetical protein